MHFITIRNLTRPSVHAIHALYCDTFWSKFKGLMFKKQIPIYSGILLVEKHDSIIDTSIHMLFMQFDIAVVWINGDHQVVDRRIAKKWRPAYSPAKPARFVLETTTDQLDNFEINDHVIIEMD
jgi:uncharacterized protein